MSQENVEIVRSAIEAFGREGVDGSLRYYHPDVEWTTSEALVGGGTFRGHEGLRRYFANFDDEFDDLRIEPDKFIDAGEQVIGSVRISGRGKASGTPVELTLVSVGSLRSGLIYRVRNYPDRATALEAAGIEE